MSSFTDDCRQAWRMLWSTVRDEDDHPLSFMAKLWVAARLICGMIQTEHRSK